MEEDQPVKFIQRMFSHAARDRLAILAVPRLDGKAEQRVFTLPRQPPGRCRPGCGI